MFHLHYIEQDGSLGSEVRDRTFLHSTTARKQAVFDAYETGKPVQIGRMRNGKLTGAYIVHPDGRVTRPLGAKPVSEREDCKAPATCFCSPCRAARRK
jgi:hypothetical protein